jgi:hypothetical protein
MVIDTSRVPRYSQTIFSNEERRQRLMTASQRALPDFIIIGAQKSGTTSLFNLLGQHPQIELSVVKQVRYFDGGLDPDFDNFKQGIDWYRSFFPLQSNLADLGAMTGEASPMYLFHPLVPERIYNALPNVKLIVILRNPTQRAISHYFHALKAEEEDLPILEALQAEEERLKLSYENLDYRSFSFTRHSYKTRGQYFEQLERFYRFFDEENLFIVEFEELFLNLDDTLLDIFKFLSIDKKFKIPDQTPKGVGSNKVSVNMEIFDYLDDHFRNHNLKMEKYIKNSSELWKKK